MKSTFKLLYVPIFALAFLAGCSDDEDTSDPNTPVAQQPMTCVECHTDKETLIAVADPLPPPPEGEGGCGGTLPSLEPYQHVYIGGPNGEEFLNSTHGQIPCVGCHNGTEPAIKTEAHAGDFVAQPSKDAMTYCGECHPDVSQRDMTSLHTQGFGQKAMVAKRTGFPSYEQFPDELHKGYDKNCGKCHSSCGECHVTRPQQAQGGFIAAHKFEKRPDMRLNCTACHSARVAHAYFGEDVATRHDIHFEKLPGGHCVNCHDAEEMHGDGNIQTQRYTVPRLPKCEDCHSDKQAANTYHSMHWDDISCQSCHSQDYQNCKSCHVNTGVREGPYMGFKIGRNPMPEVKRFKFVVLRNAPAAPDTWSEYGVPNMTNFPTEPTFRLASPHSIRRWTMRTLVEPGQGCMASCHIQDGKNKEYFLFESDLHPWEVQANQSVIVDGALPSSWN